MPEYVNPNNYNVHLTGPNGEPVKLNPHQRKVLDEYYDKYRARGFIRLVTASEPVQPQQPSRPIQARVKLTKSPIVPTRITSDPRQVKKVVPATPANRESAKRARAARQAVDKAKKLIKKNLNRTSMVAPRKPVVGRTLIVDVSEQLRDNLAEHIFPISNNIGVGILSYNRLEPLKRLVTSIVKHTDLRRTTVFISDDGSTDQSVLEYLQELKKSPNFVVLLNEKNIGVAGNSNRLIRCLSRFQHGLLLNDDVEVLRPGWEQFYVIAMQETGLHHFQYREPGVYGADLGENISIKGVAVRRVDDKPQGAVLAFTREMLVQCGYFDEGYGQYGMEHVDWSMKPHELGLHSTAGFYDAVNSDTYFRLHGDKSAVGPRAELLRAARAHFANRTPTRHGPTISSLVPEITYVVPFRNIGREDCIATVINNIRAQRFPVIHIVAVEQDASTNIQVKKLEPVLYYLAAERKNRLFNKAMAFNAGVARALSSFVVLHDADMLSREDYTQRIFDVLVNHEACHLGGTVLYTTPAAADDINKTGIITTDIQCDRVVGYYEGGSLACRVNAYWRVGGFNEDFWGYGVEDCDFYARLSQCTEWFEDRCFDLIHMWHGRTDGWEYHHEANKKIERKLGVLPIEERVGMQYEQLQRLGYGQQLPKLEES